MDEQPTVAKMSEKMRRQWPDFNLASREQVLHSHQGPHDGQKLEWWYINGHFDTIGVSFFAAFFRLVTCEVDELRGDIPLHIHALNWALIDRHAGTEGYHAFSLMDPQGPKVSSTLLDKNFAKASEYLIMALKEQLDANQPPLPDTVSSTPAQCTAHSLKFGSSEFEFPKSPTEPYFRLKLEGTSPEHGCPLTLEIALEPTHGPVLHGNNGVVSVGSPLDDMFYYFYPSCRLVLKSATGPDSFAFLRRVKEHSEPIVGRGWIDHEFGGAVSDGSAEGFQLLLANSEISRTTIGARWHWIAIQLDNGWSASVTTLNERSKFAVISDPTGHFTLCVHRDDTLVELSPQGDQWKSPQTSLSFPSHWAIRVSDPKERIELALQGEATVKDQEFVTLAAQPSFWEGYVKVSGTLNGNRVRGNAVAECHHGGSLASIAGTLEQLHALFGGAVKQLVQAKPWTDLREMLTAYRADAVGVATMLKTLQPKAEDQLTETETGILTAVVATALVNEYHKDRLDAAAKGQMAQWLQSTYDAEKPRRNDFRRILLRAAVIKQLKQLTVSTDAKLLSPRRGPGSAAQVGLSDVSGLTPTESLPEDKLYLIPTPEVLRRKPNPRSVAVAAVLFNGHWRKDWRRSEKLAPVLAEEGVNLILRKVIDSLVPTMSSKVVNNAIVSHVKTSVSNVKSIDRFDGEEYTWESSGRGTMTSRSCLLHDGQMLYTESSISRSDKSGVLERKWTHFVHAVPEAGGKRARRDDSPTPPRTLVEPTPYFCQRTEYGGVHADCYFARENPPEGSDDDESSQW